jgi:hypothetical protein
MNGRHLLGQAFEGLGRPPVRTNPERVFPLNFHQVGRLVQNIGNGFIVGLHREILKQAIGN